MIDRERHRVTSEDELLDLTPSEFGLLEALIRQPGRVFSRSELIDAALGGDSLVLERTIDVHIRSLRKKLGDRGAAGGNGPRRRLPLPRSDQRDGRGIGSSGGFLIVADLSWRKVAGNSPERIPRRLPQPFASVPQFAFIIPLVFQARRPRRRPKAPCFSEDDTRIVVSP